MYRVNKIIVSIPASFWLWTTCKVTSGMVLRFTDTLNSQVWSKRCILPLCTLACYKSTSLCFHLKAKAWLRLSHKINYNVAGACVVRGLRRGSFRMVIIGQCLVLCKLLLILLSYGLFLNFLLSNHFSCDTMPKFDNAQIEKSLLTPGSS